MKLDPKSANNTNDTPSLSDLAGKVVVLTGDFRKGSRSEITDELEDLGIIVAKGVTKKTDYVIRGSLGSEAYAFGTYGSKVRKAMDLGIPVLTEDAVFARMRRVENSRCCKLNSCPSRMIR